MECIEELVAQFIERRESGEAISAEDFARGHPESSEQLLAALREVRVTERLLRDPSVPTERLGPYRLLELIGSGGMGRVYRAAHDDRPDEELALKLLSPLLVDHDKARSRFDREARALVHLDHPGLVKVIDHGLVDGMPYLAMEWVRGPDLASVLDEARRRREQRANRTPSEYLELAGQGSAARRVAGVAAGLARAVQAAHASGVLHRDIKPGNVILREDGSPVLVDFGLARRAETVSLTGTGDLLGTPRYMAPEQARGEEADERTDIYGLGVLMYELLTLEPPHPAGEPMSVLRAVAERPVPPVIRKDPKVPTSLNRIVRRGCAFRPTSRYSTAADLASDLQAFLAETPIRARNFSPWERLQDAWVLRRKTLVTIVAGLIVLAAALLLREKPPDLDQFIGRAALAYAADDLAGTAVSAQQILAHDPEHPVGLFLEGLAAGQRVGATSSPFVDLLTQGVAHSIGRVWPQAIEAFEDARTLQPDSPLPKVLLERTRRLMARQKAELGQELPETAPELTRLGETLNGEERWAEAEQRLAQAVELDPDYPKAWVELCKAQYFQGRGEDAVQSAARGGARVGVQYANTLILSEKEAGAEHVRAVLAPILQEDPGNDTAARIMGYTYDFEHSLTEARRWYERAVELGPDRKINLKTLAFLRAGALRATCELCRVWFRDHPADLDLEEARRLYLRLLELDQGRSDETSQVCNLLKRLGPVAAAMAQEFIETLLEKDAGPIDRVRRNRLVQALDSLKR